MLVWKTPSLCAGDRHSLVLERNLLRTQKEGCLPSSLCVLPTCCLTLLAVHSLSEGKLKPGFVVFWGSTLDFQLSWRVIFYAAVCRGALVLLCQGWYQYTPKCGFHQLVELCRSLAVWPSFPTNVKSLWSCAIVIYLWDLFMKLHQALRASSIVKPCICPPENPQHPLGACKLERRSSCVDWVVWQEGVLEGRHVQMCWKQRGFVRF